MFGVIKAINYYEKEYDTFNLGNSTPIKLIDLVRKIEIALNKKAKLEYKPIQKGDVPVTYADISKSENRLGYSPKTNLDQGLKNMADWIKDTKHIS